ncbi:MAG: Holliday junction branch migration protein RuvA [Candidatus Nanopelagicales bacterium]|jgi:Holliday junction DNA helicase RuvA|nr:Holliday junction branch migration protein RuvA [Candidatus Nanopelagicales bacterium]
MIAQIRGQVLTRTADEVVVEVGGIGISVVVTARTSANLALGAECVLTTDLIVREDSLTLFGFADVGEREVFRTVQTVTGVGPRLAMTMLATLSSDQIRQAIATEDLGTLCTVPGVGRKSAQRLVVELKDKLVPAVDVTSVHAAAGWRAQVLAALTGLGWPSAQAQEAVAAVAAQAGSGELSVPEALRASLQLLDHTAAVTP